MNEFELIREVFAPSRLNKIADDSHIDYGIGDDAAVLTPPSGCKLISCVDTLIAGRHFPENTAAYAIGYKAVAVNLSDLAAMGAKPHCILLALSLPLQLKENNSWLTEFAQGLFDCCAQFGVQLIGGDTTKSEILTISVTALGFAKKCVYRSGARVGDYIAVTGTIGDAAYVLHGLLSGCELEQSLQHRLDTPTPRVDLGQWLNENDLANSMIDISDGLLQDLGHICQQSHVSARLDIDKLPTHPLLQKLTNDQKVYYQLSGGDDYELLFTFSEDNIEEVTKLTQKTSSTGMITPITIIGKITEQVSQPSIELFYHDQPYLVAGKPYDGKGYQHF